MHTPLISVILPTFNRADLLRGALSSYASQTLPRDDFQVVVIDDGSTDATPEVIRSFGARLNLRCLSTSHSGLAAAKNAGIAEAAAPILLFADDDDEADPHLLEEHIGSHRHHPEENLAVLGYTAWAPHVRPSVVMRCLPDFLESPFFYRNLVGGEALDFTYFWGGRSSCKKSLLLKYGVFDPRFAWGEEDIELGFRLEASAGLKVLFNRPALSMMARPLFFEDLCERSQRQGSSMFQLRSLGYGPKLDAYLQRLLKDPTTWEPLQFDSAVQRWREIESVLQLETARISRMEAEFQGEMPRQKEGFLLSELKNAYWWTLNAFKVKGFALAALESSPAPFDAEWGPHDLRRAETNGPASEEAVIRMQRSYIERLEQQLESLWKEIAWREARVKDMESTRVWRLGALYWQALARIRSLTGDRESGTDGK